MKIRLSLELVASIAAVVVSLIGAPNAFALGGGKVIYVDRQATGAGTGRSWTDAFTDLQTALAAARTGGGAQVWVADGVYTPAPKGGSRDASFELAADVGIYGGFPGGSGDWLSRDSTTFATILSGDLDGDDQPAWVQHWNNSHHVVSAIGVGPTAVLDGITIRGGYSSGSGPNQGSGGGLRLIDASPQIRDCVITDNFASSAGGVLVSGASDVLFVQCTFSANLSQPYRAGGMYVTATAKAAILGCAFLDNLASGFSSPCDAGGIFLEGGATVELADTLFRGNRSTATTAGWGYANGGAIANLSDGLSIVRCVFQANSAETGGAIWTAADRVTNDCVFTGNDAVFAGGAVMNFYNTAYYVDCTLSGNDAPEGGGIYNALAPEIFVENCILWGNTSPGQPTVKAQIHDDDSSNSTIEWSCVQGLFETIPGEDPPDPTNFPGCIDLDPLLADANGADDAFGTADDDVSLLAGSPCIDAGGNSFVPAPGWEDAAKSPRFHDDPASSDVGVGTAPLVDMGALEHGSTSPWTVLAGDVAGARGRPRLEAVGALTAGSVGEMSLLGADPTSSIALVCVSISSSPIPFKGGELIAFPTVLIVPIPLDAAGEIHAAWDPWPGGTEGATVYFQFAIPDRRAVARLALSNALLGVPQ